MRFSIFILALIGLALVGFSFLSCEQILSEGRSAGNGVYNICADGTHCQNVYCNMDNGGTASIFTLDTDLSISDLHCILNQSNDDMDSSILWTDLSARVSSDNNYETNTDVWMSWLRNGTEKNVSENTTLMPRPEGMGDFARPIPFPAANKTVWLDWENSTIRWDDVSVSFDSVGLPVDYFSDELDSRFYIISDGVNMADVGDVDEDAELATLLKFNFQDGTVTGEQVPVLSTDQWFGTEEDAFGNVLYTVNGRVMYIEAFDDGTATATFALGGGLSDPNAEKTEYDVTAYDSIGDTSWGLDVFARVDENNTLWFGDWGHDGPGLFGCDGEDDSSFSVAKSNVMLTYDMSALTPNTPEHHTHSSTKPLALDFATEQKISCPADTVDLIATSASNPVEGVSLRLIQYDPFGGSVNEKTTGEDGKVQFDMSKQQTAQYRVEAFKQGYITTEFSFAFAHCAKPQPNPEPIPIATPKVAEEEPKVTTSEPAPSNAPDASPEVSGQKDDATAALNDAKNAFDSAKASGKDTSSTKQKLDEAQKLFDGGDYEQSMLVAQEAKRLALNAPSLAQPEVPKPNTSTVTPQPPAPQPQKSDNNWLWILLLIIILLIAGGAYYWYSRKNKQQ